MIRSALRSRGANWKVEHSLPHTIHPVVILVDDNDSSRTHVKTLLERLYHVIEATHGTDGLQKARNHAPDLIISTIMIPYLDGFGLCRTVKQDPAIKHIPVILCSEEHSSEDFMLALEAGADSYLTKPVTDELLLAQVKNVLQNRKKIRSHYSRKEFVEPTNVPVPAPEKRFLDQVKTIVENEMGNAGFNLATFAEKMHRCERQLQRKFKAILGMTPMEYVRVMRLKRATQLIEQQAGNISEIAFQVGFKNPRHFTSAFRRFFNVSPSEYMEATVRAEKATLKRRTRIQWVDSQTQLAQYVPKNSV